jgi:transposase
LLRTDFSGRVWPRAVCFQPPSRQPDRFVGQAHNFLSWRPGPDRDDPGISGLVADAIIAETGAHMARFATGGHLASWARTCTGSNESAGRNKSTKTRPENPYLKSALRIGAMSAARSHDTYLAAKYRRIASRRAPIKAIVAVEHTILIAIWNMDTNGDFHDDLGADYYTELNPDKTKQRALN